MKQNTCFCSTNVKLYYDAKIQSFPEESGSYYTVTQHNGCTPRVHPWPIRLHCFIHTLLFLPWWYLISWWCSWQQNVRIWHILLQACPGQAVPGILGIKRTKWCYYTSLYIYMYTPHLIINIFHRVQVDKQNI